LSTDGQILMEF